MVRSVVNINKSLLQIAAIRGMHPDNCLLELSSVDNEVIIKSLIEDYKCAAVDTESIGVVAVHFDKVNEYYNKGYFVFQNADGDICYAVNNLSAIKEQRLDTQNDILVYFVKNKDLVKIIERDFALQNTDPAINHLRQVMPNASAKTINYPQMLCGSALIFFSTLFLFFNAFSIINNFAYLLQNILKAILFKRGMVEASDAPLLVVRQSY